MKGLKSRPAEGMLQQTGVGGITVGLHESSYGTRRHHLQKVEVIRGTVGTG